MQLKVKQRKEEAERQRKEEAERQRERRDKLRQQVERDKQRLQQRSDSELVTTVAAAGGSREDDQPDGSRSDSTGQSLGVSSLLSNHPVSYWWEYRGALRINQATVFVQFSRRFFSVMSDLVCSSASSASGFLVPRS